MSSSYWDKMYFPPKIISVSPALSWREPYPGVDQGFSFVPGFVLSPVGET